MLRVVVILAGLMLVAVTVAYWQAPPPATTCQHVLLYVDYQGALVALWNGEDSLNIGGDVRPQSAALHGIETFLAFYSHDQHLLLIDRASVQPRTWLAHLQRR